MPKLQKGKKHRLIITGIILIPFAIIVFLIQKAPNNADKHFKTYLQQSGINTSDIPTPEKKYGAIRYKNLLLGDENQTEISALTITFNPLNLLADTIETLTIDQIFLSGDIDIDGKTTLSSLPPFDLISNANIQSITINDLNFSILSAHFGGLRGVANISGVRRDGAMIWTGNIDSRQDQLEMIAKINAQTNPSGRWIADIEIENAKLERSFGKFTRVSGSASLSGVNKTWDKMNAELIAGGFAAHGTSWQNAAITLNGTPQVTKTFISAKSSGTDELELNIESNLSLKDIDWSARIHGNTGRDIINYLKAHNMFPLPQNALSQTASAKNISLQLKPNKNSLIFKVNNEEQNIDLKGTIDKKSSKVLTATFTSDKSINGATCTANGSSNRQLCRLNIIYENGKYIAKN